MTKKQEQTYSFVLTKDLIEQTTLATDRVRVPEWDAQAQQQSGNAEAVAVVCIREMTAAERAKVQKLLVTVRGSTDAHVTFAEFPKLQALIAVFGAINEDGSPMFAERDADWLAAKSGAAVNRIAQAVQRLSGMIRDEGEPTPAAEALGN